MRANSLKTLLILPLDILIFTLLRDQVIEVCNFLLVTRDIASRKGLQKEAAKLNAFLLENTCVLALANKQLSDLNCAATAPGIGLFDSI